MSKVVSVSWNTPFKTLRLGNGSCLTLPLSACVTKGDSVIKVGRRRYVKCVNGRAQIYPPYSKEEHIVCGAWRINFKVKEITEPEEYQEYLALSDLHYRGHSLHGRSAKLIARANNPLFPKVLGYVELATSFFMNKARSRILNGPFIDGKVAWERWDKSTARKYINVVARIARCVVSPEFRGVGIGQCLVRHSFAYARSRWHVGRLKPYFVEITADMLKFVPFVEKGGMTYIGSTEGNIDRVQKDMAYLVANLDRVKKGEILTGTPSGVVDLQLTYAEEVTRLLRQRKITQGRLWSVLGDIEKKGSNRTAALLERVLRFPKPTFMRGLTRQATKYVRKRVLEVGTGLAPSAENEEVGLIAKTISAPIRFEGVSVTYSSRVTRTERTHAVQRSFGVSPHEITTTVIKNLSLSIQPGTIALVTGPSGSGKTTLIDCLDRTRKKEGRLVEGVVRIPRDAILATFKPIRSRKPIIEVVGGNDFRRALMVLNTAGLSEAYLYLRRFEELSKGQQYRAMIAAMIDCGANVWVADDFCSVLDPVTANVVAHNIRKCAKKTGATVMLASPHFDTFVPALLPDIVIQLSSAWEHQVYSGQEFLANLKASRAD